MLVTLGYESWNNLSIHRRAYDYTPDGENAIVDNSKPAWIYFTGGGSQSFRELLLTQIMPWVSTIAPNSSRIGIWGHSLGAIFVLDCLKIIHALTIIIYLHHHFYGRMKESSR